MGKISDALEKAKKTNIDQPGSSKEVFEDSSLDKEKVMPNNDVESTVSISKSGRSHIEAEKFESDILFDGTIDNPADELYRAESDTGESDNSLEKPFYAASSHNWDERLYKAINEDIYLPEIFKALRSRILLPNEHEPVPKSIMITSVEPKEGKSFVAANLGVSLAQGVDQHCLIVNCDLRRPSISSLFGLPGDFGLADYLRGEKNLGSLIQKTSIAKLSIIASGGIPKNPAELLSSSRMGDLVKELAQRYEDRIIIYDCPPFQFVPETNVLAKLVDKIILVVRQAGAGRYELQKLIDKLGRERFLGVVFNGHQANIIDRSLMKGYSSYASSYYTGAYER